MHTREGGAPQHHFSAVLGGSRLIVDMYVYSKQVPWRRSGYTKLGDVGAQTAIFFHAFDGRENNRACAHQFVVMI